MYTIKLSSQIKPEILDSGISEDLHDVEVVDDSLIFVYTYGTGKIFRTADGGQTWELCTQLDSVYFEQLQMLDPSKGFLCGEKGLVYKTFDGGKNWYDKSVRVTEGNLLLYGMFFQNETDGLVSGALFDDRMFTPVSYKTTNGGQTWQMINNNIPGMILNIEKVQDELWGSGDNVMIRNIDKEGGWEYLFYDSLVNVGQIRDFEFISKNKGIAVTFNGYVLCTGNGGITWKYNKITPNRLRSIKHIDNGKWIASGDNNSETGNIFFSSDGGNTWMRTEDSFPDIHRLAVSNDYLWFAGKNGFIARMRRQL